MAIDGQDDHMRVTQLRQFGAEVFVVDLIAISILRELGILLTAIIVAGRTASAFTAAIGSMKMREEIDAMRTLGLDPGMNLFVPRILALLIMLPILTIYAYIIGILGGYLVGVYKLGISSTLYMNMTWDSLRLKDLYTGLFKSGVFAAIIATVACYEGFETAGGAEGVGRSTTLSVVISFILIITADCFFTALFYFVFP